MSETPAERNRRLMPNAAKVIDEFKRQFPDCKVNYVKDLETGHSAGKPTPDFPVISLMDEPRKPNERAHRSKAKRA
jgi:hypothetical protein